MVSCHQCSTLNSIDSAFCKKCGTPLADDELQEAQEKVAAWIAEGNIAFGEGRIEEAIAIATAALESNANYTDALVLKSLCYERMGNISEALACAEKVVELNPDSELDKIRRNGLRTALGNALTVPRANDRKAALMLSAAAALMVMSVVGAAIHFANVKQPVALAYPKPVDPIVPFGTSQTIQQPAQANPATTNQNPPATQSSPPDSNDESSQDPPFESARGQGLLPLVPPTGGLEVVPNGPGQNPGAQPTKSSQPTDPPPKPDGPPDGRDLQPPVNPDVVAEDPGTYEIKVHNGPVRNAPANGSQPANAGGLGSNGVEALSRTGYQQYMNGSFSAAATSFEKALHGGGDAIRLNQRLGEAYEKLGRTSDAISAYTRAVTACQEALQSGRGNKASIQATLDACQLAGKVLGG
jgi:tetratricopeptide (TPR) repeat protein